MDSLNEFMDFFIFSINFSRRVYGLFYPDNFRDLEFAAQL